MVDRLKLGIWVDLDGPKWVGLYFFEVELEKLWPELNAGLLAQPE